MQLWTIQDHTVWEQLEAGSVYVASDDRIEFPASEDDASNHQNYAYQWLVGQMAQRVGPPPEGVRYPVWAWYKQQSRVDGKPDMRSSHYLKGFPCVRMKLEIPDYEVLLTDFSDWHYALNYWYLPESEADSDEFDAWCESMGVGFRDIGNWDIDSPQLSEVRNKVEHSWERMIGVRRKAEDFECSSWCLRSFQATFWELRPEYVISVERFISR